VEEDVELDHGMGISLIGYDEGITRFLEDTCRGKSTVTPID
jgi:hypothetical protein